jgi:hypothetical protein
VAPPFGWVSLPATFSVVHWRNLAYFLSMAQVKYEPAAPVGERPSHGLTASDDSAPLFPHLFGSIDFGAVAAELPVERGADGAFISVTGV